MATYIALINWTDQGIRTYPDTTKRADAFARDLTKLGGRLVDIYWTVGPYDVLAVFEAPDEETAVAAMLRVGSAGNVRTTTMRAFDRQAVEAIVAKASG